MGVSAGGGQWTALKSWFSPSMAMWVSSIVTFTRMFLFYLFKKLKITNSLESCKYTFSWLLYEYAHQFFRMECLFHKHWHASVCHSLNRVTTWQWPLCCGSLTYFGFWLFYIKMMWVIILCWVASLQFLLFYSISLVLHWHFWRLQVTCLVNDFHSGSFLMVLCD